MGVASGPDQCVTEEKDWTKAIDPRRAPEARAAPQCSSVREIRIQWKVRHVSDRPPSALASA